MANQIFTTEADPLSGAAGGGLSQRHGRPGLFLYPGSLYKEWQNSAILRLERAAHSMDMRLSEPLQWMQNFAQPGRGQPGEDHHKWIMQHLRQLPGVSQVELTWESRPEAGVTPESGALPEAALKVSQVSPLPNSFILRDRVKWASSPGSWMKPAGLGGDSPSLSVSIISWPTSSLRAGCKATWLAW